MNMLSKLAVTGVAMLGLAASASGQGKSPADEAKEILTQRCEVCHGPKGDGNGPGGAALNPKPRNFTDAKWQKETADDRMMKVIVEGGPSVGLNVLMTPNPDLKGKDAVLKELVKLVRAYGPVAAPAPAPAAKKKK